MDVNNSFYVKEKTTAFYVQAKGEGDIGGLEYKGNAGVRAVKTDDKAIGFQGVRVIDQATNRQISSVTTAATVTSDPVPAVVGIANSGSIGFDTFSMPISFAGVLPVTVIAPMTFAASMTEPPPTARMASLPCARTAASPACSTG